MLFDIIILYYYRTNRYKAVSIETRRNIIIIVIVGVSYFLVGRSIQVLLYKKTVQTGIL